MRDHFPDLYRYTEELVAMSTSDEALLESLKDFEVSLSLSAVDTAMGTDEIVDQISAYLSDRLPIDTGPYTLSIDGVVYGFDTKYRQTELPYTGKLKQLLIDGVKLVPLDEEPEGSSPYGIELVT